LRITVRLTPRGGADRVDGVGAEGELRVRVRAAPADGAANEALLRLLAAELNIARSAVVLERGASSRHKLVRLVDVAAEAVRGRWPGVLTSDG
jgi:uncharacterized protein